MDAELQTALSDVDGEGGRLVLRGHPVETLAGRVAFEDVCALLWDGALPDPGRRDAVRAALGRARADAHARIERLGDALDGPNVMDALRASVAHLPGEGGGPFPADAVRLTGAVAVFAAAFWRRRSGATPIAPDPARPHGWDFLRLLDGAEPSPARAAALDAYLCTVADHGMNASTYAARVVASTGSDVVSAVVAAIGALKGPLHGGAPGPVLDMLDAIGAPARAEGWLRGELDAGRRIMGMGHRIYRVRDPRAAVLEVAYRDAGGNPERRALAALVERTAEALLRERHPGRRLCANVEFYTALLLEAIGVPRPLFTAVFGASRVAGWCAHVEEQRRTGRLIRPASRYVGPLP